MSNINILGKTDSLTNTKEMFSSIDYQLSSLSNSGSLQKKINSSSQDNRKRILISDILMRKTTSNVLSTTNKKQFSLLNDIIISGLKANIPVEGRNKSMRRRIGLIHRRTLPENEIKNKLKGLNLNFNSKIPLKSKCTKLSDKILPLSKKFTCDVEENDYVSNKKEFQPLVDKEKILNNCKSFQSLNFPSMLTTKTSFLSSNAPKDENIQLYSNLQDKSKLRIPAHFKKPENFIHYLIESYISKHNQNEKTSDRHKKIFFILSGTVLINEIIKGVFLDIPNYKELTKKSKEQRNEMMVDLLNKLTKTFHYPKPLLYIFTPDNEMLLDLLNLRSDTHYLIVSNHVLCDRLKVITTPALLNLYNEKEKEIDEIFDYKLNSKGTIRIIAKNKKTFKIKSKISKYDEIYKKLEYKGQKHYNMYYKRQTTNTPKNNQRNYSFANGEFDKEKIDYYYYSECEGKEKAKIQENIEKNCRLKNDFFIYINERSTQNKLSELKKKFIFDENHKFNLFENYKKFNCDFDKIINQYMTEICNEHKVCGRDEVLSLAKDLTLNEVIKTVDIHNFFNKNDQLNKVFINKKEKLPFVKKNVRQFEINQSIDKKTDASYPNLTIYNIPKILKKFKNFTRSNLYEIFVSYKNLISLCYSMNKTEVILKYGIDFETFWKCVREISREKKVFVEKLFTQINQSKSKLLSFRDFMEGMYFIKNTDLNEKLDLFLKALDNNGNGELSFNEVYHICRDSILRNLNNNDNDNDGTKQDSYPLQELTKFFAEFVYDSCGVDRSKNIKLKDIKEEILKNTADSKYLQMFCGSNLKYD